MFFLANDDDPATAKAAFCVTVDVNCSIDAAVCSSALACDSVRADKSMLPDAISLDAVAIVSALSRIAPIVPARLPCMVCIANSTLLEYDGREIVLTDTAGLRKRGQMRDDVEHYSQLRAIQAAERGGDLP